MTSFIDQVAEQIMHHEGVRLAVYDDATGKPIEAGDTVQGNPTIGVGRLLTHDRGITEDEVMMLLRNDLTWVAKKAESYGFWHRLDSARQMVIMGMIFNMGNRFDQFKKMIAALEVGDYIEASAQMLDSRWAKTVKGRAVELAEQMRTGVVK
jgi:lysozyme